MQQLMTDFRSHFEQRLTVDYSATNTPYTWLPYPIAGVAGKPAFPVFGGGSTTACKNLDEAPCGGVILRQIAGKGMSPSAPIFQETAYFTECVGGGETKAPFPQVIPSLGCPSAGDRARVVVRTTPDNTKPSRYTESYFPAALCIRHVCNVSTGSDSLYVETATAFLAAKGMAIEQARASFPLDSDGNSLKGSKVKVQPKY
jgi:hypothetical protein